MRLELVVCLLLFGRPGQPQAEFGQQAAVRFAALALECVGQEYPNKIAHVLTGDQDVLPPRELTPAFFGCYDWHSAVHGHWLLARLCRTFPEAEFAKPARAALQRSLTVENIEREVAYLQGEGRVSFERPYGLAWLLQLAAELREWDDPDAREWSRALSALEQEAARRLADWLPKLTHPIRTGEHSQTAFAMGLALDWARVAKNAELEALLLARSRAYYLGDRGCNLGFEPGGQDFLSPCLAEADLMRRVLGKVEFAAWLGGFLPELSLVGPNHQIDPAVVSDKTDGKLAHLDGLNLSRAWMLEGIAAGLPEGDPRSLGLLGSALDLRRAGLEAVTGEHYAGGHWLGSFAVYLVSRRGL